MRRAMADISSLGRSVRSVVDRISAAAAAAARPQVSKSIKLLI